MESSVPKAERVLGEPVLSTNQLPTISTLRVTGNELQQDLVEDGYLLKELNQLSNKKKEN